MSKILFWIVVVFVVLFALRLANLAKAKARRQRERPAQPKAIPPGEPTVRCDRCGVFLPKADALPSATGYRCTAPACANGR